MKKRIKVPAFPQWILKKMPDFNNKYDVAEDLRESYIKTVQDKGKLKAYLWYWHQVLFTLVGYLTFKACWGIIMLKNYLIIALRNIRRHKGYSFINIAGLTIGIMVSILIMLYVQYELSYDKFHANTNDIYRIIRFCPTDIGSLKWKHATWPALASALKRDFPEVIKATRVDKRSGLMKYHNMHFIENKIYFVDPDFLEIFTFPLISGNPRTALSEPFSILLTQKMVKKYFGNDNPIGKTISYSEYDYKITGILRDIPENTHLKPDFLVSFNTYYTLDRGGKEHIESWKYALCGAYIKLKRNFDPDDLENKFPLFLKKYMAENRDKLTLQPAKDIHLLGNLSYEYEKNSDIKYVYLLSVIAFLIMLIACFNYMNLSAARSAKRAQEVGMRKIIGAKKAQLIRQFLGESMVFTVISMTISILLVIIALPAFGSFIGINFILKLSYRTLFRLAGITVFIGIVSGSYPAFFLSSLNPLYIIKGKLKIDSKLSSLFRNSLVVAQFGISIIMIVSTLVIYNQLAFIKNRNLGFKKELIVTSQIRDNNLKANFEPLKNELLKHPSISNVSVSKDLPSLINTWTSDFFNIQNNKARLNVRYTYVDYNFTDLYGMELIKGRKFSKEFTTDKDQALIINETTVKELGLEEPIGKRLFLENREYSVIGVIKDFHFKPLHQKIEPLAIRLNKAWSINYFSIKINPENISETLIFLEEKFKEFSPGYPFDYSFLDERINMIYKSEQKLGQIFSYFTFVAIFLTCLGLFGLGSFKAEQRTKEIGIRKVVGASVSNIFSLLSKEFVKWIITASIIAWPIAHYAMIKWLQNFAYRTHLSIWIFILSGLAALAITLLTVSYQTIKAARANPVDSLRYE